MRDARDVAVDSLARNLAAHATRFGMTANLTIPHTVIPAFAGMTR
jgi:hypothetical protein